MVKRYFIRIFSIVEQKRTLCITELQNKKVYANLLSLFFFLSKECDQNFVISHYMLHIMYVHFKFQHYNLLAETVSRLTRSELQNVLLKEYIASGE